MVICQAISKSKISEVFLLSYRHQSEEPLRLQNQLFLNIDSAILALFFFLLQKLTLCYSVLPQTKFKRTSEQ